MNAKKCSHEHKEFVRNIHGDEINQKKGARSIWRCKECGKVFWSSRVHEEEK